MSMDIAALRALPRAHLQRLARRDKLKANAKSQDIIHILLEKYPNGVPSLEEQTFRRKSGRLAEAAVIGQKVKKEPVAESIWNAVRLSEPPHEQRSDEQEPQPERREIREANGIQAASQSVSRAEPTIAPRSEGSNVQIRPSEEKPQAVPIQNGPQREQEPSPNPAAPDQPHGVDRSATAKAKSDDKTTIKGATEKGMRATLRELAHMVNEDINLRHRVNELDMAVSHNQSVVDQLENDVEEGQCMRKVLERHYLQKLKDDSTLWDGSRQWTRPSSQEQESANGSFEESSDQEEDIGMEWKTFVIDDPSKMDSILNRKRRAGAEVDDEVVAESPRKRTRTSSRIGRRK